MGIEKHPPKGAVGAIAGPAEAVPAYAMRGANMTPDSLFCDPFRSVPYRF
jgi:hypothetical protein